MMFFVLGAHPAARGRAIEAVRTAPDGMVVSIKPATRNTAQNAALHAMLTEISKRCKWAGQSWDVEDWKRLLTAAWCRATRQSAVMVPAVDGQGFDVIYRRTSGLTKAECSELLDYINAWAAEHMPEETT